MTDVRTLKVCLLASASVLAAAAAAPAFAQDGQDDGAQERRSTETITVTAQKRGEENVQDIPVAVSAYSAELLEDSGVKDIKDLQILAPGLNVTSTSNTFVTTARIRGVGTVGDNPGLESSVGIVIDGVTRSRNGISFGDLGEIEAIEVLRGPQGTLFGKNTSAGIINIRTAGPEYDFSVFGDATYFFENGEGYAVSGGMTGPLVEDKAAFRIFGKTSERDGYLDVATLGGPRTETEDDNTDFYTFRGDLLLEPETNFRVRLQADYSERDESCCLAPSILSGPATAAVNGVAGAVARAPSGMEDPFSRQVYANRSNAQEVEDWGVSGQFDYDLENFTLTGILSHRSFELGTGQDTDFTGADIVYRDIDLNGVEIDSTTFELRAAGATDRLEWLVGGFYSDEEINRTDAINFGVGFEPYLGLLASGSAGVSPPNPALGTDLVNGFGAFFIPGFTPFTPLTNTAFPAGGAGTGDVYEQTATSYALFTNNTLSLTEQLDFVFGLRWTHEEKDAMGDFGDANSPACDVYEAVLGDALDFTDPTNQAIINGFAGAAMLDPAAVQTLITFTCLPLARDVYDQIDFTQSREEDEVTGTAKLAYRVNEDLMTYASYSRGYKAGGFNLDRFTTAGDQLVDFTGILAGTAEYPAQFDPEIVDSFEVGFKTEWFDNQLLANLALFYSDFETYQLNTFNGFAFFVTSVDGAESVGGELELLYLPAQLEGLTLQGGATYAETEYDDFPPIANPPTLPGAFDDVSVLSGKQFSLAPKWYLTGAATYRAPLSRDLEWLAQINARYVSEQNTGSDLDAPKIQDAYTIVNARLGISQIDETWGIELFSNNLLDEEYIQVGFDGPFQPGSFNAFLGKPRSYGVTVRGKF